MFDSLTFNRFFNLEALNSNRLSWLDYSKGLAILLVVYRHVLGGYYEAGIEIPHFLKVIQQSAYNFRMPLFFILAGIFIVKSFEKRRFKNFILYKANTILYPYIIWGGFQLGLQIFFSNFSNNSREYSDFLYLIYLPREIDQFWFLYTLFNVSILFIFIYNFLNVKNKYAHLLFGLIFHFLSGLSILKSISLLADTLHFYIYFAIGFACSSFLINRKYYKYYSSFWLLLLLLPVFIGSQWYWIHHPSLLSQDPFLFAGIAIIGSAFTINLAFILSRYKILIPLRVIGIHSLYIYIMHVIIQGGSRVILFKILGINNLSILLLITILLSVLIPIVFYNTFKHTRLDYLFTISKAKAIQVARITVP